MKPSKIFTIAAAACLLLAAAALLATCVGLMVHAAITGAPAREFLAACCFLMAGFIGLAAMVLAGESEVDR